MTVREIRIARYIGRRGIVYPFRTVRAARKAGISVALACALLEQESGGGHNVFGHDRDARGNCIWPCGGPVARRRYLTYRTRRKKGLGMQGVGPMQLTWWAYQDEADRFGGCWKPYVNMLVGFRLVKSLCRAHGFAAGIARYNGTGRQADLYSQKVRERYARWKRQLRQAGLR